MKSSAQSKTGELMTYVFKSAAFDARFCKGVGQTKISIVLLGEERIVDSDAQAVALSFSVKDTSLLLLVIDGAEGDRTPDLMTASHALSQLSYGPTMKCSC